MNIDCVATIDPVWVTPICAFIIALLTCANQWCLAWYGRRVATTTTRPPNDIIEKNPFRSISSLVFVVVFLFPVVEIITLLRDKSLITKQDVGVIICYILASLMSGVLLLIRAFRWIRFRVMIRKVAKTFYADKPPQ